MSPSFSSCHPPRRPPLSAPGPALPPRSPSLPPSLLGSGGRRCSPAGQDAAPSGCKDCVRNSCLMPTSLSAAILAWERGEETIRVVFNWRHFFLGILFCPEPAAALRTRLSPSEFHPPDPAPSQDSPPEAGRAPGCVRPAYPVPGLNWRWNGRCFPRVRRSSEPLRCRGAHESDPALAAPSSYKGGCRRREGGRKRGREKGRDRGGERRDKGRERVRGEDTPIPVPWHCMLL